MAADLELALASLREQLAELDALHLDEQDAAPLREELLAAIAEAEAADVKDEEPCVEPQPRAVAACEARDGIHPRNRYAAAAPDFGVLAETESVLRPFLVRDGSVRATLDFTDFGSTRALTAALLQRDFGVSWWLPDGHLCPTLTSRCNYVHWVEDLLALLPGTQPARGLDIGTGASCVYALLGAALNGWAFVATDVTPEALTWARRNVAANPHLAGLIQVRDARAGTQSQDAPWPILRGVVRAEDRLDFTLCNPPFFQSLLEAGRNPGTACGGTAAEMVCPGGEAAFVAQHIEESRAAELAGSVRWFTTLVGKKATLRCAVATLRSAMAPGLRTACFSQGRTTRWGVAWSWLPAAAATQRLPLPVAPPSGAAAQAQPARACARASLTVRVGARDRGAPAAALAALRDALASARGVRDCQLAAAAFSVAATLEHEAGQEAPTGGCGKRKRAGDPPPPASSPVTATLQEQAPGLLSVSVQLRGGGAGGVPPQAAQVAFGALVQHVQSALALRWPSQ